MELKDFVKETLVQIVEGVKNAQDELKNSGCVINPAKYKPSGRHLAGADVKNTIPGDAEIGFEVVLTQGEVSGVKSGIGVAFANIGFGGQTKTGESNSSVTSIKFSVPIRYPENE